jgi:hypothetical protein
MRKSFTFFILIAVGFQLMAQSSFEPVKRNLDYAQPGTHLMSKVDRTKAPGDVLFMEDFAGERWAATSDNGEPVPENAPEGWILGDDTGNGFNWRWDTIGARGQFTSYGGYGAGGNCAEPREAVLTPTHDNGYLMLEMDYFNSGSTCDTIYEEPMDAYIQYDAGLDFSAETAAHLIFEQANRFCCEYSAEANAWFEVSVDGGVSWSRQIVSKGEINIGVGDFGADSYYTEIDISELVVGQTDVKFRFHIKGLSHYFWIIDDVSIFAPENYDIKFVDYWNDYLSYNNEITTSENFSEGYYEYPLFLIQEYKGFHVAYVNYGGLSQANLTHRVDILRDGQVEMSFISDTIAEVAVGYQDTIDIMAEYQPEYKGKYTIAHYPVTDHVDLRPDNDTLKRGFIIGDDQVMTVDFNKASEEYSVDCHSSFDQNGDGLGFILHIPNPSFESVTPCNCNVLNGVYVYIASNSGGEFVLFENEEAMIIGSVYKIDEQNDTLIKIISTAETTLTVDDTSTVKYLPFIKDGVSEYIMDGGKFLIAFHMYGTWVGDYDCPESWDIKRVGDSGQKVSDESFVTVDKNPSKINDLDFILEGLALGLHISPPQAGVIGESEADFVKIYPNPSNGRFTISGEGEYNVQIVDVSGKVLYESKIMENETINLQALVNGVYFARLTQHENTVTKILVIN